MAAKTNKTVYWGTIERAEIKEREPFAGQSRYAPYSERKEFYLDVALRLDDGRTAYFKTPACVRVVASAPGVAIVHYSGLTGGTEAGKWMREVGDRSVATPGVSNNRLEALVRVGDRIAVTGNVKAEKVSRVGRPYIVLNYIRRQSEPVVTNICQKCGADWECPAVIEGFICDNCLTPEQQPDDLVRQYDGFDS